MRAALHAEWTKARTTPGPAWLLLATAATAAIVVPGHALAGIYLAQTPAAILAVLTVTGEFGTGLIAATLTAVPNRITILTTKALAAVLPVAATSAAALTVPATLAHVSLRAYAEAVLYLALIALLALGAAAAIRDSAAAIGTVLGLLYLPPILAFSVADPDWQQLIGRLAPMTAGPMVLAGWAAGALLTGALLFGRRDTS
jgi:ABC-2 type transport system permease protein